MSHEVSFLDCLRLSKLNICRMASRDRAWVTLFNKTILLEKEFSGYFDRVVFAVYSKGRNGNFSVFSAVWGGLEVWTLHMYILGSSKNLLKQIGQPFDN